jgi:hypothetical protein
MDSWRGELECSMAQAFEDSGNEFEVQLMEDIFFVLKELRLE